MKTHLILSLLLLPFLSEAAPRGATPPDLPPDSPSSMYRALLGPSLQSVINDGLEGVVGFGERNLQWLEHINDRRPAGDKLSLTSKETQRGIPIDKPSEYNVPLIQEKLNALRPQMPRELQEVIFEGKAFTDQPPVAIPDYLNWSRELDRVYQSALRWRTMSGWLYYLAERRHQDIRGWYFLSRLEGRAEKLRGFARLPDPEKAQLRGWLVGLCYNDTSYDEYADCERAVDAKIAAGQDLEAYYQSRAATGQRLYQSYFDIPAYAARPEVRWDIAGNRVIAPFADPGREEVRRFLQDNIQDEWRFGAWRLELPFQAKGGVPRVEFLPGVTPHVNGLGGDTITMNANQPLTEYDAQWTIRHEYGHVLGFPDCYVEFYEQERNVIVNYQFDVDNLMCSRRGHIQEQHVRQMERVYRR